jgi:hypothetical protein
MKDFDEQTIEIGDVVVFMTTPAEFGSCFLKKGTVVKETKKSIRIELSCGKVITRQPHRVARLKSLK